MKKKKIFITLQDYSLPNSTVNYGAQLAKNLMMPATLIGIESIPVYSHPSGITGLGVPQTNTDAIAKIVERTETQLNKICLEAKKVFPLVDYKAEIGFWENGLLKLTEKEDPFLMVMAGNSELNTVNEWFGTYETRVAEKAECPVLVLPQKPVYKPVKNILYIADLNDETVENMRTLTTICKSLNAHLTMAVVSDQVKEKDMEFVTITKTFRQLLGYDEVTYHQIFSDGITETIARLTQKTNANWLAFEQKNKSFFKRLFDDYNTKRLILQSEIPVLVF